MRGQGGDTAEPNLRNDPHRDVKDRNQAFWKPPIGAVVRDGPGCPSNLARILGC